MANLVTRLNGMKAYVGLLSPEEVEEADKLLRHLQKFIPQLEKNLAHKYPTVKNRVYFAHEFGAELRKLVEEHDIKGYQEKFFWEQIREFASESQVAPEDRQNRMVYDYYFKLAAFPLDDIKNINWAEWSYILDTPSLMKEERIIVWLVDKAKKVKFKRNLFRELMTGIRLYIKNKDLAVYTNTQFFYKMEMIYQVVLNRLSLYDKYFTSQNKIPSKARLENKKKYREKYLLEVFQSLKRNKNVNINELCNEIFKKVYYVK